MNRPHWAIWVIADLSRSLTDPKYRAVRAKLQEATAELERLCGEAPGDRAEADAGRRS